MEIAVSETGGIDIVSLEGKIMGTPEESVFKDTIQRLAGEGRTRVVIDMSKLDWMTSSGLGACLSLLITLRSRGGDMRLTSIPPVVRSLMERCRIISFFNHFETVEDAVRSFEKEK